MKLRRFLLPDARWNAPGGPRTVVNLTRPTTRNSARMKIRQLVFPGTEWYAKRPVRSAVNLTRPGPASSRRWFSFGFGVWRYAWRLLRLRDATASFLALTPGGVRVVDAASYASIPWRVIQQSTLHVEGHRSLLCLAIDAGAPADISWAVLRAPVGTQILPGRTVLWLRLQPGQADSRRLGLGL